MRRASRSRASVPGIWRMPSWANAQSCRSIAGAYSRRRGPIASKPMRPTIGSTSTWLRIAVVPWRTARSSTRRARSAMSSRVKPRLAAPVTRIASLTVPSRLGARAPSRALSRWMWESTSPGVTTCPSHAISRAAARPASAPISTMRPARQPMSATRPSGSRPSRSSRSSGTLFRRADSVRLQLPVQVAALDAEALGGAGHVPLVGTQRDEDEGPLEGLARLLERALAQAVVGRRLGVRWPERGREVLGADDVARAHDDEPLDHVAQLAHVAGPVVRQEVGERLDRDGLGPLAVLRREERDEVGDQQREVFPALPQRRHLDRDDVQAVVEILAERAGRDALGQVLVGGSQHPHVHPQGVLAAHPLEGLLLERPQHLGLGLEAHVPDLVEEERALIRELELAAPPRHRPGEGAALVAEELGLDQLLGDRRAVDLDEGALAPRGEGVHRAGHQLLAGAVLALDEHPAARGRGHRDLLAQVLDQRALADDLLAPLELGAQVAVLALEPGVLEGPGRGQQRLLERERLLDEVVGAELGGLDRGLDGAVAGDHHHRELRPQPLHLGQGVEAVDARHPDVEEDDVRRVVLQARERLLARAHRGDPVSLVFEHASERGLDRPLVVNDQDVLAGHAGRLRPARARPPAGPRAARPRSGCRAARCPPRGSSRRGRTRSGGRSAARAPYRWPWWRSRA